MKHVARYAVVCGLLSMSVSYSSFAGEKVSSDSLESALKGNTVEGRKLKWKTTYKMYLDPSGRMGRVDSLDNVEAGEWRVDSDGALCIQVRKNRCRVVEQRDDGGYDVFNQRGQKIWTMDTISPGNPYGL